MGWDIIYTTLQILVSGFGIMFGVVFIRSAWVASQAREGHAATTSGSTTETVIGNRPKISVAGRGEAFQEGMSYDRKTGKLIPQAKLSNDYIDSLIG